ncbi:hypothetical protein ACFL14_01900 [Patescibacteria group bacterium]
MDIQFPDDLDIIKLDAKYLQGCVQKIRDRMNMGVWSDDVFLHTNITNMENIVQLIINSSDMQQACTHIQTFKSYLSNLDQAVRDGKYDSRSIVGDYTLDMRYFLEEIDKTIARSKPQ